MTRNMFDKKFLKLYLCNRRKFIYWSDIFVVSWVVEQVFQEPIHVFVRLSIGDWKQK